MVNGTRAVCDPPIPVARANAITDSRASVSVLFRQTATAHLSLA
jgi:hypothetical protein